ncbi:hypothetical protein [Amnibacterium endophyticum]|uniref:Uncharacterized protein n=1 Tax=Amnibacterium endophyticum TaxID=2109337 RepID=A0ABW4LBN1_9MICO
MPVTASAQVVLDAARDDVLQRLDALPEPRSVEAVTGVVAAMTTEGAPWVAADGTATVGFEAQVGGSGCLIGSVPPSGRATVETGGFIMDGGCHALTGH